MQNFSKKVSFKWHHSRIYPPHYVLYYGFYHDVAPLFYTLKYGILPLTLTRVPVRVSVNQLNLVSKQIINTN